MESGAKREEISAESAVESPSSSENESVIGAKREETLAKSAVESSSTSENESVMKSVVEEGQMNPPIVVPMLKDQPEIPNLTLRPFSELWPSVRPASQRAENPQRATSAPRSTGTPKHDQSQEQPGPSQMPRARVLNTLRIVPAVVEDPMIGPIDWHFDNDQFAVMSRLSPEHHHAACYLVLSRLFGRILGFRGSNIKVFSRCHHVKVYLEHNITNNPDYDVVWMMGTALQLKQGLEAFRRWVGPEYEWIGPPYPVPVADKDEVWNLRKIPDIWIHTEELFLRCNTCMDRCFTCRTFNHSVEDCDMRGFVYKPPPMALHDAGFVCCITCGSRKHGDDDCGFVIYEKYILHIKHRIAAKHGMWSPQDVTDCFEKVFGGSNPFRMTRRQLAELIHVHEHPELPVPEIGEPIILEDYYEA